MDPEDAANINRAFAMIMSLNELDQQEIRNVVSNILSPTLRELSGLIINVRLSALSYS